MASKEWRHKGLRKRVVVNGNNIFANCVPRFDSDILTNDILRLWIKFFVKRFYIPLGLFLFHVEICYTLGEETRPGCGRDDDTGGPGHTSLPIGTR
jgi:hypothetical protein